MRRVTLVAFTISLAVLALPPTALGDGPYHSISTSKEPNRSPIPTIESRLPSDAPPMGMLAPWTEADEQKGREPYWLSELPIWARGEYLYWSLNGGKVPPLTIGG